MFFLIVLLLFFTVGLTISLSYNSHKSIIKYKADDEINIDSVNFFPRNLLNGNEHR